MEQRQANEKDVFEFTRAELNSVLAYLGKKPAEEVFGLVSLLLSRAPARLMPVEEAAVAAEAPAAPAEEEKTTEQ